MRITHYYKENTKAASYMINEFNHSNIFNTIYSAYERPSYAKVQAYNALIMDYKTNNGLHAIQVGREFKSLQYNGDIRVISASCHVFTTIASFTDTNNGDIYLIKETHCNTYACKLI